VTGPVLVVEDDDDIRQLLLASLEQEGFRALSAADGEEAIRVATATRPAAVILDVALPKVGGAEVAARMRDLYPDGVPLLVVSATDRIEDLRTRIRAERYLAKPFDLDELVSAVRMLTEPLLGGEETATAPTR